MFFGLLAAVNLAVALFNVWLGLLVSFAFGPAYIITAIVLAVFAFTETAAVPQNGAAEPSTASDNKRRKVRRTFVVVALLLLIAVPVFLFLLSSALSHTDFR